jgi:hypothetical protein
MTAVNAMSAGSRKKRSERIWADGGTALAVRLAVIPFLYRDWLDPFVLEHWAFGRVARSLVAGHGFGNVFADTGPTAVVAPVYAYLLAAVFRLFGDVHAASIIAALALNSVFSALTCIPRISSGAPQLWCARRKVGRMGLGIFSVRNLLRRGLGLVDLSGDAAAGRAFPVGAGAGRIRKCGSGWAFGALGGLAALTEPVVLAVIPLFGLWTCWRRLRQVGRTGCFR